MNTAELQRPRDGNTRTVRDLALLLVLTLVLHLPFVRQAFQMDDVNYLDLARNVFRNPLFPLDLPYVFEGRHVTMWGHTHPPLSTYFIAGLLFVGGDPPSEVFLHSVFLIFPVLATAAFYFLARRFVRSPLLATAILVSIPALSVSAHTLMADAPLLALWLWSVTLFVYGADRADSRLEMWALLPLTAAVFCAYQGLALIPLLGFYTFQRKRLNWRLAAMLCLPILLLAGWQLSGYLHNGTAYAGMLLGYVGDMGMWLPDTRIRTAVATLTYLGGTIILFPFLFAALGRRWRGLVLLICLGIGGWLAHTRFAGYGTGQKVLFVLCFTGGLLTALSVLLDWFEPWRKKTQDSDTTFLAVWFLGVVFYCVFIFFSGSARYLLPAAPPLVLLLVRASEHGARLSGRGRAFYAALVPCQLLAALLLSHADYQFARTARQEALDFEQRYLRPRQPFLFSGEWGFRYYLSTLGGHIMAEDSAAPPGTLVIKSRLYLSRQFDNELDRSLQPVERREYRVRSPLRLLDYQLKAGFWSDGWGVLPFWFSRDELDEITVYRAGRRP